jgi:hypothetical protein
MPFQAGAQEFKMIKLSKKVTGEPLFRLIVILAVASPFVFISGCKKAVDLKSDYEVIGQTETKSLGMLLTLRDRGTGCEFIMSSYALLPRNERSSDGFSVKQRCIQTGSELEPASMNQSGQPAATPAPSSGDAPAFVPPPATPVEQAQEEAIRKVVQEEARKALEEKKIPPPKK